MQDNNQTDNKMNNSIPEPDSDAPVKDQTVTNQLPSEQAGQVADTPSVEQMTTPGTVPEISAEQTKTKSKFSLPSINKKLLLGIVAGLLLIIVIFVAAIFLLRGRSGVEDLLPQESGDSTPTPFVTAAPASPYVNDADVLKIEKELNDLDTVLNNTDLREDTLRVPVLEWSVSF